MTRIAVIGGTGYAGSHIVADAVARGLAVTAVSRSAAEVPDGVAHVQGSYGDTALVKQLANDHDVVVLGVRATGEPALLDVLPELLDAVRSGGARLGVVGGAGSTLVAEGGPRLIDTQEFPEEYRPEASAHGEVLEALRADESDLRWFYVSPAAVFGAWAPGEPTGSYRTSDDVLLADEAGTSTIGGADFATAFVDEIVDPAHDNTRFHVAY